MNLIAQLEAEQIAALGKTIPDFKAGDTVRVGYKVTEGTRSPRAELRRRVHRPQGRRRHRRVVHRAQDFALAKAWNVCSRSIRPTSTRSRSCVAAGSAAPSSITCAIVAANPPGSPKTPTTKPKDAPKRKERDDEKRHSPRIPHHRRQDDRWHRVPDQDRPGARKATRCRSTSTRWRTRPGPAASAKLMDTGGRVSKFKNKYAGLGF